MNFKLLLLAFVLQAAPNTLAANSNDRPGLEGTQLEEQNKHAAACKLYRTSLSNYKYCSIGVQLRLANCLAKTNNWTKAWPEFENLLKHPWLKKRLEVLYEPAKYAFTRGTDRQWKTLAKLLSSIRISSLDSKERDKLAELFSLLSKTAKSAKNSYWLSRSRHFIYIELAETPTSLKLFKNKYIQRWWKRQPQDVVMQRAAALADLNRNDEVINTLEDWTAAQKLSKSVRCRAQYMLGKAYRKKRHYKSAKKYLHQVINTCHGASRRSAFFIASRLAAIDQTKSGLNLINRFLKDYPNHSYSDDAMLWKINVLQKVGTTKQVASAYETFFKKYAHGDMFSEGAFQRAFFLAKQRKTKEALKILKSSDDERFVYWYGRLLLYPRLDNMHKTRSSHKRKLGTQILKDLNKKNPATYYGYMAGKLVSQSQNKSDAKPFRAKSLERHTEYKQANCLINSGYDKEAILFLKHLFYNLNSAQEKLSLAKFYLTLNRPDLTYEAMRYLGLSSPYELAFPKAYEKELSHAAKKSRISPFLLTGLAREESAFEKDVVSWAGAHGLCQLMPEVGKEQARRFGIKYEGEKTLFDPKLNAMFAGDYVARFWKVLEHPLLAIAAYNGGLASVKRWMRDTPQNTSLDVFIEEIPYSQTRAYVKRVTRSWLTYTWLYDDLSKIDFPLVLKD